MVKQRSPTFLAPGTGFEEVSFSTDRGGGWMVQAVMQAMGGMVQVVMRAVGSDGELQMKLCSLPCLPLTSCCVAWAGDPCGKVPK